MSTATCDVFVYGSHPGAISAACAAAQRGAKVVIAHHAAHIGSPYSHGLGATDTGRYGQRMLGTWIPNSFFNRITAASGGVISLVRQVPWLSEVIFGEMLRFYGVYTLFGNQYRAASVSKTGARTDSVTFDSGDTINFTVGIDGSDELDLLALAGVTLASGREAAAQYNESLGGFFPVWETFTPADTGDGLGGLINGYAPYPNLQPGDADTTQQTPGWRRCLTRQPGNTRLVSRPPGYDPALFERLRRAIPIGNPNWRPWGVAWTNWCKGDANDDSGFGYMDGWGAANTAGRTALFQKHYNEVAGYMYFLQTDASIDPTVQAYARTLTLARDEFQDTTAGSSLYGATQAGWPYGPYIRDCRRFVGQYVMTQADAQTNTTKADSLSVGQYSLDNHTHQLLAVTVNGVAGYIRDSLGNVPDVTLRQTVPGLQYPARGYRPLNSESTNLLSVNISSSAVFWSHGRIDVNRFLSGGAVGCWAGKAIAEAKLLDAVSIPELQTELVGKGHLISFTP